MPPKASAKSSAKALKAKAKKERQLLEAKIKECQEKCMEARGYLEPTGRNAEPHFAKAKAALDAAIAAYKESSLAYFLLGKWYRMQGMYPEAIENYSNALDLEPTNVQALEWRGYCYQATHDFLHAMEDNTSIIALDPDNDHAYNMRGLCVLQCSVPGLRLRAADFECCLRDFSTAVRLNEANYYAMANLGKTYEVQGQFKKAMECYGKALDKSENYAYARFRRGCLALQMAEAALLRRGKEDESSDNDDEAMGDAATSTRANHLSSSRNKNGAPTMGTKGVPGAPAGGATDLKDVEEQVRREMEREQETKIIEECLRQADSDLTVLLDPNPEANKLLADVTVVVNIGICALLSHNFHKAEEYFKLAQDIIAKRPGLVDSGEAAPIDNVDTVASALTIRLQELHSKKEQMRSTM